MPSPARRCRSGAACSPSGRTPRSMPRARRLACPPGRWATARWATSTWAPAGRSSRTCRASMRPSPTARSSRNPALLDAVGRAAGGRRLHLVGLLGPGGVHSVDRHAVAVARLARAERRARRRRPRPARRARHAAALGRSVSYPTSRRACTTRIRGARIATIGGRYYGMDRDKRWERIKRGYDAIVHGEGLAARLRRRGGPRPATPRGESDEFVQPTRHRRRRRHACATATSSSTSTSAPTAAAS